MPDLVRGEELNPIALVKEAGASISPRAKNALRSWECYHENHQDEGQGYKVSFSVSHKYFGGLVKEWSRIKVRETSEAQAVWFDWFEGPKFCASQRPKLSILYEEGTLGKLKQESFKVFTFPARRMR